MSAIYGVLGVDSAEHIMLNTMGEQVIFDASQEALRINNAEVDAALSLFIEETTSDHKRRYKLPGGGRMQRRGGQAQSAAVRTDGSWDVAFPLESFGDQIAADREEFAYMTVQELDNHIDTITNRNIKTLRHELLYALLNNTQRTFVDHRWGSLTVEPLANGDAVLYPPALGLDDDAAADFYLESGYAASAISDTNDPVVTAIETLESRFGAMSGGSNIVVFHNNAQSAKLKALTAFVETPDAFVQVGDNTPTPVNSAPSVPGRVIGRHDGGAWLSEWRWMPANYVLAIHMDAPKPLIRRVHPGITGLGTGLQLVSDGDKYPFTQSHYEHDFGFGVGNRLNGVVIELGTGGTYTIPTAYA